MSNTVRIAKNTLILYFRQLLILLVGLYTVRVKLEILGVEDFGIYNIVGGIVVIFSFFFNAMINTTQRFLNFSMGENAPEKSRDIFSASLVIHLIISIIVIIIAETVGLLVFYKLLNIPDHRHNAAFIVYQLSVLTTVLRILHIPYYASIIANEKMSFFAFLGFIDVILKLGVVLLLSFILYDKLIVYSILLIFVYIFTLIFHIVYCLKNFKMSHFRLCKDKNIYKQISSFSVWTSIGNISNIFEKNGVNIIVNVFYGVILNAAMGIATQVNGIIYTFVNNFQTAFKPQLVKYYASNDISSFIKLIFRSCKISIYLLFLIILPFYLNAGFVLKIWLKNVPDYAVIFTQLMLLTLLENSISDTLLAAAHATGNIKKYELFRSVIIITNLPLSFFLLWLGYSPYSVFITKIILTGIIIIWQVYFLGKSVNLPVISFILEIIIPFIFIFIISSGFTYFIYSLFMDWTRLFLTIIASTLSIGCLSLFFGINKHERVILYNFIKNKLVPIGEKFRRDK